MKMRKSLSLALSICALFTITTNSLAVGMDAVDIVLAPESNVTYEEIPSHVRNMVNNGDLVFVDEDEHYYIIPATLGTANTASTNTVQSPRSLVYLPNGGTYTFTNPILSSDAGSITYLLNVSFIPITPLVKYLIYTPDTSLFGELRALFYSEGAVAAVTAVAGWYGITVSTAIIGSAIAISSWYINYAEYNAVKAAHERYCPGVTVGGLFTETRYIHNKMTGIGNIVTTFASWGNNYATDVHYGLTGTLNAGVYCAGGTALVIPE